MGSTILVSGGEERLEGVWVELGDWVGVIVLLLTVLLLTVCVRHHA
jgi:hypothetical protein